MTNHPFTRRPLLVTGSNRSGTTWVGRMLCASRQFNYVYEPFNPGLWPRWTAQPIPYRNLYVCAENEEPWLQAIADVVACRRPILVHLEEARSPKRVAKLARDAASSVAMRRRRRRTLLKDPIAIFSAPWLADRFRADVLVMIRNPLGFAASIKRLGWAFDFTNWLRQDLLMRDLLWPFEREIVRLAETPGDLVDQAILLWNAHHHAIATFRDRHPTWIFVTHESLAERPVQGLRALYNQLGIPFDDRAERTIRQHSSATPSRRDDPKSIRRDSPHTVTAWATRLNTDEIARIREGTREIAERFYPGESWSATPETDRIP